MTKSRSTTRTIVGPAVVFGWRRKKPQTTAPSAQTPSAQTSTPTTQAQTPPIKTPTAKANDKSKGKFSAKANTAKMAHQRRHSTHLARHDRGFKHGRYYAYVKPHHKSVHHSKTMTQH
jgi:hypothetical protein